MWGSVLDPVLSKYHWTLEYALWEVSYVNLTMLQVDEYMLYEERKAKNGGISQKGKEKSGSETSKRTNLSYGELITLLGKNL